MSALEISHETALNVVSVGSLNTQQDCADVAALLRADTQASDPLRRTLISLLERAAALPTWEDYQQISAEACAEFDQSVGIRMVPVSNPAVDAPALRFRIGGMQ